jgi:hypothetical protein
LEASQLLTQCEELSKQAQREMLEQHFVWLKGMDAARETGTDEPLKPEYQPSRKTRRAMDVIMKRLGARTWEDACALAKSRSRLRLVK